MKALLQTWLTQQCQIIPGSQRGTIILGLNSTGEYDNNLLWPDDQIDVSMLQRVIQATLRSRQAVIKTRGGTKENTGEPLDSIACPIFLQDKLIGAVAIEMTNRSQQMQQTAIQQLQTGLKWLETMARVNSSAVTTQLITLVELIAAGLDHENFNVSLNQVANELAKRFSCQQVCIGFIHYKHIQIKAISHSQKIDQNSTITSALRDAMTEALDQGSAITFPVMTKDSTISTYFHEQLAQLQGATNFCTLPLIRNGKSLGAILLERPSTDLFSDETVKQLEQISQMLGPVLQTRRKEERPLLSKATDSLYNSLGKIFGSGYLPLKVSITALTALVLFLTFSTGQFSIASNSTLEANLCRVIVAPQNGFIDSANVRPGDMVREDDLMATLDTKDLLKEQRKWSSQREQLRKEYRKALADFDRSEVAIIHARRQQAEARLQLVEQQLSRTQLIAPFSGVVVKGDLSQRLGTPVEQGEVLYEIAPTDHYNVILEVEDQYINMISAGQKGKLRLTGIPDQLIAIQIDRITPVSTIEGQHNVFRVEASMMGQSDLLRPGMQGVSRVEIGERRNLWIWTRQLLNWARMMAWNWLP
jgi:multidrug resistance efflux pump